MNSNRHKLSVLHVATALSWRGGEQQVAYLISELKKSNVTQVVLCSKDSAMEKFCINNNITFYTSNKGSALNFSYGKKIHTVCKQNNIDIIHTHDSHAHTYAILAVALFGCKSKIVVSRRVDFEISSGVFSKYKYNHPSVKRILCVSEAIKIITSKAVNDKSKVVTVHSGINLERFENSINKQILHTEFFLPPHIKIVANIAAIAPHKDYFTFVDAVEILSNKLPDTVYFIIGDGPDRSKVEHYINSKKLNKVIFLTGFRTDIPDILPELDVMLITSETEGLGTAILDAFACKVPVVATAAGGIPEIVIHEKTGLLAAVKDAPGLAANVSRIFDCSELKQAIVDGASIHLKKFSTSATALATLSEYHAVMGFDL